MRYLSMSWKNFNRLSEVDSKVSIENQLDTAITRDVSSISSLETIRSFRFDLFGDTCAVCNRIADEHKLVLHRKDGKSHHRNSTWTKEFLQTAIVDEWVMLCDRCHTGVHWYMEYRDLKWNWIKDQLSKT
jgi:hypothetical protein